MTVSRPSPRVLPQPVLPRARASRLPWLALLAATLLLSGLTVQGALSDPTASWPGDPGDPEQTQFFLAWIPFAIGHGLNPLVTHYVLYPAGANLMWNTAVPLPALVVSPITVLFGPTVAYDVLFVLAGPTTALAAYALFRRWVAPWPAAVGAFCFAISPYFRGQSDGHLHLILLPLVPLTFLALDEIVVRRRWPWWRSGLVLGLLCFAQLMTAEEILATDALFAVIGILVLAVAHRDRVAVALPHAARALAVTAVVFGVLAAYPLWLQFFGPFQVHAAIHSSTEFSTDLANVVMPTEQLVGGSVQHHWTGNSSEWGGYLGVPLLVVLVCTLRRSRPVGRWAAGLAIVAAALSLGPWLHVNGHRYAVPLPWWPLSKLPVVAQILPARLMLYAALFAGLALAVFLDGVRRSPRLATRLVAGLAAAVVVVSWLPDQQVTSATRAPAGFAAAAASVTGPAALVLPIITGPQDESPQLWLARTGFPFRVPEGWVIAGNSIPEHAGPVTATWRLFSSNASVVSSDTAATIREEWRHWQLGAVVVAAPDARQQRRLTALVSALLGGAQPRTIGSTAVFDLPG